MTSNGGDSEVFNACDRKAVSGEPWGYSLKAKIKGRLRVNGAKLVIIGDRRRKRAWRTALSAYTIEKGKPNGKCRLTISKQIPGRLVHRPGLAPFRMRRFTGLK